MSALSDATLQMFNMNIQDLANERTHQDIGQSRVVRDESFTMKLVYELERFEVFDRPNNELVVISTPDVAPHGIQLNFLRLK